MTRTNKYLPAFATGGFGLMLLASPLFLNLGSQMPDYVAQQQIASNQELERKALEERKLTNQKVRETGLPIAGRRLFLSDYLDDPNNLPKIRKTDLARYKTSEAWVFDGAEQCVGRIIRGKFISKHNMQAACKDIPNAN